MATKFYDAFGRTVVLGRQLASGGEGGVYEVTHDPTLVAKVYHKRVDAEKIEKLETMVHGGTPELLRVAAWPMGTLHETPRGELAGIVLPKVVGHREIHELYSPAQRKFNFPKADWGFIAHVAMNCAAAFEAVHAAGHVIGDVNQSGLLVSSQATIRLIDCDSFQIKNGSRVFPCVVGVPQFTPPELQGLSTFKGIIRTHAHDNFGLALLIFHLLFMGRHPFAGRFCGAGDMPIEKAIAEGRFAFGRSAFNYQMTPPPHSLPLDATPPQIGNLFERAFSRPNGTIVTRPNAFEWRQALQNLKASLKQCPSDPGHKYSNQLNKCPWCEILLRGGPNFFISVHVVVGGVSLDLPIFDVASLWARIEMVLRPPEQKLTIPQLNQYPTPVPLPQAVQEHRQFLRIVSFVFLASLSLAGIGVFTGGYTGPSVLIIGVVLAIVFGVWTTILKVSPVYRKEMANRRTEMKRLQAAFEAKDRTCQNLLVSYAHRFDGLKNELLNAKETMEKVRPAYTRELEDRRRQIDARKRETQLQSFLDRHFIRDYKIPKIGSGRQATLLSYGIETAADINSQLDQVPGFGPAIIGELTAWRAEIERKFRFDPTQPAPNAAPALQAILLKYRQLQQSCEVKLTRGYEELKGINADALKELPESFRQRERLYLEYRQAEANTRA